MAPLSSIRTGGAFYSNSKESTLIKVNKMQILELRTITNESYNLCVIYTSIIHINPIISKRRFVI